MKLISGSDLKPSSGGPTWIWEYLQYNKDKSANTCELRSVNMRTPIDYWEIQVQGEHYCKLLSPYRALEWIYVDAIKGEDPPELKSDT